MTFDSLPILRKDPGQVGASLELLGAQILDASEQFQSFSLPASYRAIDRVAILGMGGSHLGADIVRSIWSHQFPGPVTIVPDYVVPGWVNRRTLVIASSYSGNTEETIEGLKVATRRRIPTVVIAAGGRLVDAARYYRLPLLQFVPSHNPSKQPRLGLGYSLVAFMTVFQALGWLPRSQTAWKSLAAAAERAKRKFGRQTVLKNNIAKQLARDLKSSVPLYIGAEWMVGNLHAMTNQLHENAKTFATWYALPDLNHHLLEGLRNRKVTKQMHAVLFSHPDLHTRTQTRVRLTEKIIKRLGAKTTRVRLSGKIPEAAIELLAFGGYVSWYLSAVRRVPPAPIPTVDELKKALGAQR